jgi:hypothetical protein
MRTAEMLSVLANGRKLIPFDSVSRKNLPKGKLCSRIKISILRTDG